MDAPSVSMVVPVYNEREIVLSFFDQSFADLEGITADFEVIAVDDGSTDGTSDLLAQLGQKRKNFVLVSLKENTGIGLATVKGLEVARKSVVFWNTVDRVIDTAECLKQALTQLQAGYDAVTFYRENLSGNNPYQKILTIGNNTLISLLFPWKFMAYQQFQFHRTQFVHSVIFESSSHFIGPELLFKSRFAGLKMREMATTYHRRTGGKPKGGAPKWVFKTTADIIALWLKWIVLKRPMRFVE